MATSGKFNQYDKPWCNKLYGTLRSATYENSGCAPTAMSNIIYAWDKSITPLKVGNYIKTLKQGRTAGGATYKTAIEPTLKHFGGKPTEYSVALKLFKKLYDDKCKGIESYGLLDVKGSRGGITWTEGGHYVSIRDIKKNGDNDFLLRIEDPGWRKHDAYYSYRTHLQGCIKWCWYVTSDKLNKTTKTTTTTKKSNETIAQEVLDNKWGSGDARKKKLTEAGYDYEAIQKIVNELIKKQASTPKTSTKGSDVTIAHSTSSGAIGCKTRKWYKATGEKKWQYIMRPKDSDLAEKIGEVAKIAPTKSNILYAKDHKRHTGSELALMLSKHDFDMNKVTEKCYTVCTDYQMCCVLAASPEIRKGITDYGKWAWSGYGGVKSKLSATGKFDIITDSNALTNGIGLRKGDLIVSETHGVIVVEV